MLHFALPDYARNGWQNVLVLLEQINFCAARSCCRSEESRALVRRIVFKSEMQFGRSTHNGRILCKFSRSVVVVV